MYEDAQLQDFKIHAGRHYLADAGFGTYDALLVPCWVVQYQLSEWGCAGVQWALTFKCLQLKLSLYMDPPTVRSYYHASARNPVEQYLMLWRDGGKFWLVHLNTHGQFKHTYLLGWLLHIMSSWNMNQIISIITRTLLIQQPAGIPITTSLEIWHLDLQDQGRRPRQWWRGMKSLRRCGIAICNFFENMVRQKYWSKLLHKLI